MLETTHNAEGVRPARLAEQCRRRARDFRCCAERLRAQADRNDKAAEEWEAEATRIDGGQDG